MTKEELAAAKCPADIIEFGYRHRIPQFAESTWQAGFIAGLRASVQATVDDLSQRPALTEYDQALEAMARRDVV